MVQRLLKAAQKAVKSATGGFGKKRVIERRLLPVLEKNKKLLVVHDLIENSQRFVIPPHQRSVTALVALLRGANGQGPLPLFGSTNVGEISGTSHRVTSFIEDGVEYDVLMFAFCNILGVEPGTELQALAEHTFMVKPLRSHPLAKDIKRVLNIA